MFEVESLLERAAASLPGATRPLLTAEFEMLFMDFCRQSRVWRDRLTGLATENKVLNLKDASARGVILGVIGTIDHGNRPIRPTSVRPMPERLAGMQPWFYYVIPPGRTVLGFSPPLSGELTDLALEVYLGPLENSFRSVPDELFLHYSEALLAGIQGRMMLKPKKPYSDARLGAQNMSEYRMGVNQARHQANKGRTTAPEIWAYPRWA